MLETAFIRRGVITTLALIALTSLAWPSEAAADELSGTLTDGATGVAIEGAQIQVLGTNQVAHTDKDGRYSFDLPAGKYELAIEARLGDQVYRSRLVNQHVPQVRPSPAHVYTDYFLERGHAPLEHPMGLPAGSGRLPEGGPDSVDLSELFDEFDPTHLTIPSDVPTTIRVGRRQDHTGSSGCTDSSNPIVAIDEMPLDDYVKGVLPPEIGVFSSIAGASEVYKAFGIAAKSYGLYFMLVYDASNRRDIGRTVPPHDYSWFHIDDTACNQRYSDERMTITTNAAEAVASKILVDKADTNNLGKYEYAASCGRHGTLPEHGSTSNLVPDDPPENGCSSGGWCGHDDCAGHQDNPNLAGDDRCLVRGICQWGAASWGKSGKSYTWMLDHYQPNLQIREVGTSSGPETVTLTGYVHTDPNDISGSGVAGASVELSDGQTTTSNQNGKFWFAEVEVSLGTVDITVSKAGYHTNTRSKDLQSGVTNWASTQITPDPSSGADAGASDAGGLPDAGSSDAGAGDAGDAGADLGSDEQTIQASFGPLVQPSQGIQGGCSSAQGEPVGRGMGSFLLMISGLFLALRRRAD